MAKNKVMEALRDLPSERESRRVESNDKARIRQLEKLLEEQSKHIERSNESKFKLTIGKARGNNKKSAKNGDFVRVIVPDSHGSSIDMAAAKAFLNDLEEIQPAEIVMMGDHIDCGGFLAQHHTMGYVAETSYCFEDDVGAANQFIDEIQKRCPNARIDMLEGNHERRIEKWIVTQVLGHQKDAAYLRRMFGPELVLNASKRGISYFNQGVTYDNLPLPATIKRGKCFLTHGEYCGKHAASQHLAKYGGNVVFCHCFSEDTEVLTDGGWKTFDNLVIGSTVATIRLDNAVVEWQKTTDLFHHDHFKEMVSIKSPTTDILVTKDHAMVTTSRKSAFMTDEIARGKFRREKASDLLEKSAFTIPLSGLNEQPDYPIEDDLLRFFGWVITEGNVTYYKDEPGYISIAQSDNPSKGGMIELERVLDSIGAERSKTKRYDANTTKHGQYRNYDAYRYNIFSKNKCRLEFDRMCPNKQLQPWMMKLSARQFKILFDTLIIADGCKNKNAKNSYQYATSKPAEADLFQSLCAINGYRTCRIERIRNGAKYSCITANSRGLTHITKSRPVVVPYSGRVWCCSVPNQTLILRRNGKVFVAGNTHRADFAFARTVSQGVIGAWNPGCLCILQRYYMHTAFSDHSHGYGVQLVRSDGGFLHINIPIIDGESYISPLISQVGRK